MKRRFLVFGLLVIGLLLIPLSALAQDTDTGNGNEDEDVTIRINGDLIVTADEIHSVIIVINGDVTVDGTIEDTLVVINGAATINGSVGEEVVVVRGDLTLGPTAVVEDVMLVSSDLVRDEAATVNGDIEERSGDFSFGRGLAVFSTFWWIGSLIVGLVAAALFAWLGRRQLFESIDTLRGEIVPSIVTALIVWIGLPIIAVLIAFTIVGIPLTISIFLVLLPILWALGAIVIAAWIGSYALKPETIGKAIGAALLGVVILAVISLIPFIAPIVGLAGMLGAGALVYRAFKQATGRSGASTPPPVMPTAPPAP